MGENTGRREMEIRSREEDRVSWWNAGERVVDR
jgi:hypothetical protein